MPQQPAEGDAVESRVLLRRAVLTLSDDERELLRLRFIEELAQAQIGVVLGVNQMGVARRLSRVMDKLRNAIGDLDEKATQLAVPARGAVESTSVSMRH